LTANIQLCYTSPMGHSAQPPRNYFQARPPVDYQPPRTAVVSVEDERFLEEEDGLPRESFDDLYSQIDPWHGPKKAFLLSVRMGSTFTRACRSAHISRKSYQLWRKVDPLFNRALQLAMQERADILIEEARRRAVDGVRQLLPIVWKGEVVGWYEKTDYSDKLLQYLLETEAAEVNPVYRKRREVQVGGKVDHFMRLAESAESSQEEYDRRLEAGEEDVIDGESRELSTLPPGESGGGEL